ncbi:hypothetical protein Ae201684P_010459 [Aphanomyces euteiches]|uniref:Uncharacterized protein n=1 Tax=Aphanomyces euteiches TaxID=100861 RepID=A0A6G0WI34_9STRA|nr:hypothetical protein Ae201684_015013 [Aphanomyces euteiches]KAH9076515.1 hypothetical protein Ae201684P_010459 [Aphanomyces euteiches]
MHNPHAICDEHAAGEGRKADRAPHSNHNQANRRSYQESSSEHTLYSRRQSSSSLMLRRITTSGKKTVLTTTTQSIVVAWSTSYEGGDLHTLDETAGPSALVRFRARQCLHWEKALAERRDELSRGCKRMLCPWSVRLLKTLALAQAACAAEHLEAQLK